MRTLVILGLAVVGLQFGCGAGGADLEPQSDLTAREDQLVICRTDHRIIFYSDAAHTTQVGDEQCYCNKFPSLIGRRTTFRELVYSEECL